MQYIKDQFIKLGKVDKYGLHVQFYTTTGKTNHMLITQKDVPILVSELNKLLGCK